MSRKLYPHNKVKSWYAYEVEEIGRLFGVHPQTIRAWIKNGLLTIDDKKPTLIFGAELIAYIKDQNVKGKCSVDFDQMFCMKCQDARFVYQSRVILDKRGAVVHASGLCRTCQTRMNKAFKLDDMPRILDKFYRVDVLELRDCENTTAKTHIPAINLMAQNESQNGRLF